MKTKHFVTTAILCVFLMCSVVLTGCPGNGGGDGGEDDRITVPGVVGFTESSARTAVENARLVFSVSSRQYSSTVDEGDVISQSPGSGTRVDVGSTVSVVVSNGEEPNNPLEEAAAALLDDAVDPSQAYQEFSDAFGEVVATQGLEVAREITDAAIAGQLRTEEDLQNWIDRSSRAKTIQPKTKSLEEIPEGCDTVVIFINGVFNARIDAKDSYHRLKEMVSDSHVFVDYYYNFSLVSPNEDKSLLGGKVILPCFSRIVFPRIWETVQDILEASQNLGGMAIDLAQAVEQWSPIERADFLNIISLANSVETHALGNKIREYTESGLGVVIVSHSQGNLFARDAVSEMSHAEKQSVAIVEVASPSLSMPDPSYRIDVEGDWVAWLSLLRFGENGSYPDSTNGIEPHAFQSSYLEGGSKTAILEEIEYYREMLLEEPVEEYVWQRVYGGEASDIFPTSDNGYILSGAFQLGSGLLKIDRFGDIIWEAPHDSIFHAVREMTDGGYVAAGENGGYSCLVKFNNRGELIWEEVYGNGFFNTICQIADGGYVAAGENGSLMYVAKVTPDGLLKWSKTYGEVSDWVNSPGSIEGTTDGGCIIGGAKNIILNLSGNIIFRTYGYLIKMSSSGSTEIEKTYEEFGIGCAAQIDNGGYLLLASGGKLAKTNPEGEIIWERDYFNSPVSFDLTADGGWITVGRGANGGSYSVEVSKVNSSGDSEWGQHYGTYYGYETGISIKQTLDGGYIILGAGDSGMLIVKTDADGNTGPYPE